MKHRKQYPFIICIKCLHVPLISIYNERVIIKCRCEPTITFFDIKAYIHLLSFFDREIQKHFKNPVNKPKINDIKYLQRTLDLLEDDDDVQQVYHNWSE